MSRLGITGKISLSIGVFVVAYVLSAGLDLVQGRAARSALQVASGAMFPAAQRSQAAEASFQRMVKGFRDAVIMQDESGLNRAAEEGRQAAQSLESAAGTQGLAQQRSREALRLAGEVSAILTDCQSTYKAALAGGLSGETQEKMRTLGRRLEQAGAALAATKTQLATDLQQQLTSLEEDSIRQAKIALLVFLVALAGAALIARFIVRSITKPLAAALELVHLVAQGDLTRDLKVSSGDEIGQMLTALNTMIESTRSALIEVSNSASRLTGASEKMASGCVALAAGTHQSTATLEEIASTLKELTDRVRQNSNHAKQGSELSDAVSLGATNGGAVVQSAVAAMAEIDTSSRRISDIISSIDEIAFQTNLLALNAAIEAARAGDTGRGFAVVAQEVRALAQRSAVAAKEIEGLIKDSVIKVKHGSEFVNQSGRTLQEIVTSAQRAASVVSQISTSSAEEATGIQQVCIAVNEMNRVTQSSSDQTQQLSSTAQQLSEEASDLRRMLSRFVLPV